ncbi:zinc finger protein with KRAB and SCAN domains 5-like [Pygocentrus nattereri]|uniref:zinc finger protein with KRAB and SCAN domains 5-like n=1 Tax=Pygocentrus nattereri TaxID=42514 RepID=UPI0018914C0D|nr:zinc finger protein with KRAB and SCAN domains 5-like [Pygocentrus nattereri]
MTKMEHLNSFFIERLMSVAAEIFEAIQDTVSEYQVEIERAKRENRRLRERLTEINSSNSSARSEQQTPSSADVQLSHADGAPLLQSSNRGLLDSDPSVLQLKLEVATRKQEDPTGDQSSHAVPQELPTFSQESLDSKSSFIQVKVELSTMHQDTEPQGPLNNPTSSSSPSAETVNTKDPLHNCLGITIKEEKVDYSPHNTGSTIKLEPLDSQVIFSNDAPSVMQRQNVTENHWEVLRDDQGYHLSRCKTLSDHFCQAEARVQSQTAEDFFCCRHCGKPFRSHRQLKQHQVVHQKNRPRPYRCDLCGKSYSYAQVLENHRRTHTGERPYNCRFCGRCFKQRGHLIDHERIHTGERPFSCSVCGKRFIQSSQVKKHVRNHHQAK